MNEQEKEILETLMNDIKGSCDLEETGLAISNYQAFMIAISSRIDLEKYINLP